MEDTGSTVQRKIQMERGSVKTGLLIERLFADGSGRMVWREETMAFSNAMPEGAKL